MFVASRLSLTGRRALGCTAPLLALALASPIIDTAAADRPAGGGAQAPVTCGGVVSGHPGDTYTTTATQVYKGVAHGTVTVKHTCGADGQWTDQIV